MLGLKFIFRKSNGKVLGAQALGEDGPAVDKRISALAMAIQMGATIYDLEESELCYAPQFGSAKDPVNFAGMMAANVLRGDMPLSHWDSLDGAFLLDVRHARRNWSWRACRARSTSRCRNSAPAWANFPATARSTSSAAPPSAPTTPRASFCRTGSKPKTSLAACCHGLCAPLLNRNEWRLFMPTKLLTDREPRKRWLGRGIVVKCGSPLPLSTAADLFQSSKTWRTIERLLKSQICHN